MGHSVQDKETIFRLIRQNQRQIHALGVSKISLFGSFLTDGFTPESDVDLLVEFRPGMKTYDNFMELLYFLEDLLGRRVELVTPQSLSPYIGPSILSKAEHVQI